MDIRDSATTMAAGGRTRRPGLQTLMALRNVITAAAIWVLIGLPTAGLLSTAGLFLFMPGRSLRLFAVASVLGAVDGLWLTLGGRITDTDDSRNDWPGAVSGAVLGLLGIPVVFAHMASVLDGRMMALFVIAVACGGTISGLLSFRAVSAYGPWGPPTRARSALVGCLMLFALGIADGRLFWSRALEKLPVPVVTHEEVANIEQGSAHGSQWSGCYKYTAREVHSPGSPLADSGVVRVEQNGGELRVTDPRDQPELQGRVDSDGRFRVGSEHASGGSNGVAIRVLWEGRFSGDSATFTKRRSFGDQRSVWSWRFSGTARRTQCPVVQH